MSKHEILDFQTLGNYGDENKYEGINSRLDEIQASMLRVKLKYLDRTQTLIDYPIPVHNQNAYIEWNDKSYYISEKVHNKVLSLPINAVQSLEDTMKIVEVMNDFS